MDFQLLDALSKGTVLGLLLIVYALLFFNDGLTRVGLLPA